MLAQEGVNLSQIVIVDDKSSDDTPNVIEKLWMKHPIVSVIHNAENRGPGYSRNVGLSKTDGDWIALLDADDAYLPLRLRTLIEVATKNDLEVISDLPLFYDLTAQACDPNQLKANLKLDLLNIEDLFEADSEKGPRYGVDEACFRAETD